MWMYFNGLEKYCRANNWYRLKGKCFSCNNGSDEDTWTHRKKDCLSFGDDLYINNKCNLSCSSCDNPSFILHWRFNCGLHDKNKNDGYYEPTQRYLIAAISTLAKNEDIPEDIFIEMNRILLEYK